MNKCARMVKNLFLSFEYREYKMEICKYIEMYDIYQLSSYSVVLNRLIFVCVLWWTSGAIKGIFDTCGNNGDMQKINCFSSYFFTDKLKVVCIY